MHESPAAEKAAHLARLMESLRDSSLQVGWVREQLSELGAARAADVLTVVLARAEERNPRYALLLLRVSLALANPEAQPLRRAIAGLADVRQQHALARFLAHDPKASGEEEEDESEGEAGAAKPQRAPSPEPSRGRPLTLGERKSLARRRDRTLLARVLRDPHPDVIRILLNNPALIEDDIVRLCALRPVNPDALSQVFVHPRWILRYRVKHALARNPYTPEPIVLQLIPHLTPLDRRELSRTSHASDRVREACVGDVEGGQPLH